MSGAVVIGAAVVAVATRVIAVLLLVLPSSQRRHCRRYCVVILPNKKGLAVSEKFFLVSLEVRVDWNYLVSLDIFSIFSKFFLACTRNISKTFPKSSRLTVAPEV